MSLSKILFWKAALFASFVGIASLAPILKQQLITGSIVNALLLISLVLLGREAAILIGFLPSLISLSLGFLPLVFAPFLPFIIVGNIILVLVFGFLRKKNYWLAMVSAGFLKFVFLAVSSSIAIDLFIKSPIAKQLTFMMSWPQLFTAICGGILAYLLLAVFYSPAAKRTCPEGDTF
ncbi:MAG: iron hydrogenase [Candidatus Nealsonbacteria bacterium]|nr:iron hydrogenase [Candidatus Nealsonbacteria bacterium]